MIPFCLKQPNKLFFCSTEEDWEDNHNLLVQLDFAKVNGKNVVEGEILLYVSQAM